MAGAGILTDAEGSSEDAPAWRELFSHSVSARVQEELHKDSFNRNPRGGAPKKRGSCAQEGRRGLCHTAGRLLRGQGASPVWLLLRTQRHLEFLEPPQPQECLKPLREMSSQALTEMIRET